MRWVWVGVEWIGLACGNIDALESRLEWGWGAGSVREP
jgi:hypothetical protein